MERAEIIGKAVDKVWDHFEELGRATEITPEEAKRRLTAALRAVHDLAELDRRARAMAERFGRPAIDHEHIELTECSLGELLGTILL